MTARISSVTELLQTGIKCFHCGDACEGDFIKVHQKNFCCEGCKLVYEILEENNLSTYYTLNATPGDPGLKNKHTARYEFLEKDQIKQQLITFTDGNITNVTFLIPQIHCSSCIWLLENLYKLNNGVLRSTVNFLKREVHLTYNEQLTSLRQIASLLDSIGYSPQISLDSIQNKKQAVASNKSYYKLGVAFFCFGNIMLLSFPEYFGLNDVFEKDFKNLFGILNLLLSLPVLLYADTDFFKSAIAGLRQRRLNMDFPISLGIIAMYGRSLFEILTGTGTGYMDTFAALIFFMLVGRLFQSKTYDRLSFERDYKSYFPVAVTVIEKGLQYSKSISEIRPGNRILIHNEELIPADSILIKGNANIDYSFVTGENIPISKYSGDKIYAGGKQIGTVIELEAVKEVSQSRLTQLWNDNNYGKTQSKNLASVADRISVYFSIIVLLIAIGSGVWYLYSGDPSKALNAFTAVLIITCPCALALSYPFTLGNSIRILGNNGFYLKNTGTIEKMAQVDTLVFDKTGTLTKVGEAKIDYEGIELSERETEYIASIASQSIHPLSRLLTAHLKQNVKQTIDDYVEYPGEGLTGIINGMHIKIGSWEYAGIPGMELPVITNKSSIHVSINSVYKGCFYITGKYREGLQTMTATLAKKYSLNMISGDNSSERSHLENYFGKSGKILFEQSPSDKLAFIKKLQNQNKKVMMIGDGLNDAGALRQSHAGISISDNINNFSPACDGILEAGFINKLPAFLKFSKTSMRIIYTSYFISLLYNVIGTWFAIQGNLSPVFAAIIMPLSTVTIILFTTFSSNLMAYVQGVK